ncbi:hypothetical protein PR001_g2853 [Phytophthora rubi]|uniref:Uncharacterized protein n=1 Tax=Phytophthora rubi TaxID=129364 RepID=A0A6A3NT99_9STRA|nr:hypothetical protein PR002_g2795 [Phytophthora rubi]KAE9049935.1 hypothetical protein PR001_g2853 [Phytophthora rubi]
MYPGSVNEEQSLDGRYAVEVFVKIFDERCKDLVFNRLKAGATKTNDPLVMKTFVQVEDPQSFRKCMKWKHEEITEAWDSYLSMEAAVD